MKKILICLILSLSFVGCDSFESGEKPAETAQETAPHKNEIDQSAYSDSIVIINDKICSLDSAIQSLNSIIEKQNAKIKECKENKSEKFFWAIVVAIILVWLLSVYDFLFCKSLDENLQRIVHDINKQQSNLSKLADKIQNIERSSNSGGNIRMSDIQDIKKRLDDLERTPKTVPQEYTDNHIPQDFYNDKKKATPQKTIKYFGNVKGNFFNDIYDSCKEEAKFQVEIAGDKGEFKPIKLDRIKSLDNIDKAVKYEGVQLSVATDYDVLQFGAVEKDGDVWMIRRPVILKLK